MLEKIKIIINDLKLVRRSVLYWAMCMTTWAFYYVFYSYIPSVDEPDPMLIGAILTPATGLLTFVTMFYNNSRTRENLNGN